MDEIKELLDEAIKQDFKKINTLDLDSEERKAAVTNLVSLYKLRIEESKNEMEAREKKEARMMELDEKKSARFMESEKEERSKRELLKEQTKDRYVKIGIATAEIVLPLAFYGVWMKRGFKFEETGAFTSTTFRGLFGKFKPTKK